MTNFRKSYTTYTVSAEKQVSGIVTDFSYIELIGLYISLSYRPTLTVEAHMNRMLCGVDPVQGLATQSHSCGMDDLW